MKGAVPAILRFYVLMFTIEEARNTLKIEKNRSTLNNLLAYHLRKGHIIRIRKGLYYTIPRGQDAKTYPTHPYLIAGKIAPDSTLAYYILWPA
jgi:predicted transcriptional regulator of viral defense system